MYFSLQSRTERTRNFNFLDRNAEIVGFSQCAVIKTMACSAARRGTFLVGTAVIIRSASQNTLAKAISPAERIAREIDIAVASPRVDERVVCTLGDGDTVTLPIANFPATARAVVFVNAIAFGVTRIVRARIVVVTCCRRTNVALGSGETCAGVRAVVQDAIRESFGTPLVGTRNFRIGAFRNTLGTGGI